MYIIAYLMLVAAFLAAVFFAAAAVVQLWQGEKSLLIWLERGFCGIAALISAAALFLFFAFVANDYSLDYVVRYSDNYQSLFYRLTAFWAGQEGSLLFWAWAVTLFGVLFLLSRPYARLNAVTRLWFWVFFLAILAFFLLLLSSWNNPFLVLSSPPTDGNGLNPLLQNPGMIFHPPLLFIGYGGFVVPACLALAQTLAGLHSGEAPWRESTRSFTLFAWAALSAGIVLGAWWAYMELGWGGYWAWDPVENASLLPWLAATAFLHTSLAEGRSGLFKRANVFLINLTVLASFAATYIVRSGALQSLHAYSLSSVGGPLLVFCLFFLLLAALVSAVNRLHSRPLEEPLSREGVLALVSGLLLITGAVVLLATIWPLLSQFWSKTPEALKPGFYNRVCLPVFTLLCLILAFCPWLCWGNPLKKNRSELERSARLPVTLADTLAETLPDPLAETQPRGLFTSRRAALLISAIFLVGVPLFWFAMEAPGQEELGHWPPPQTLGEQVSRLIDQPPRYPLAQLGASAAVAAMISLVTLALLRPRLLRLRGRLAAHGVHFGLLLIALGIAFSGPYQVDRTLTMRIGQKTSLGDFEIVLNDIYRGQGHNYSFYEAELLLNQDGHPAGTLTPERRKYSKYSKYFAEMDTRFSLGGEASASLLAVDEQRGTARLRLQISPLVNWIWIGGVLLCLFPLLGMFRRPARAGREV